MGTVEVYLPALVDRQGPAYPADGACIDHRPDAGYTPRIMACDRDSSAIHLPGSSAGARSSDLERCTAVESVGGLLCALDDEQGAESGDEGGEDGLVGLLFGDAGHFAGGGLERRCSLGSVEDYRDADAPVLFASGDYVERLCGLGGVELVFELSLAGGCQVGFRTFVEV